MKALHTCLKPINILEAVSNKNKLRSKKTKWEIRNRRNTAPKKMMSNAKMMKKTHMIMIGMKRVIPLMMMEIVGAWKHSQNFQEIE